MIDDPETKQLISRLKQRTIDVPRYVFDEVNFSLILMLLARERLTTTELCGRFDVKPETLKKWRYGTHRPRERYAADLVVATGVEYLMPEKMHECGVTTDEYKEKNN